MNRGRLGGPAVLSLLLHAVVAALLLWAGVQSHVASEPPPVAVELWSSAPPPPVPADAVKPAPVLAPAPTPAPVDEAPADVNLGRHAQRRDRLPRLASEPAHVVPRTPPPAKPSRPEPKPQPKVDTRTAAKPKARPEPAPTPRVAPAPPAAHPARAKTPATRYDPAADDMLAALGSAGHPANGKVTQAGKAGGVIGGSANGSTHSSKGYEQLVISRVKPLVAVPAGTQGNPRVVMRIRLLPSFEVGSVSVFKPSGNPAFDNAVRQAVLDAGSFPHLLPGMTFDDVRDLKLTITAN